LVSRSDEVCGYYLHGTCKFGIALSFPRSQQG
jgi:hypothetical protein